MRSDTDRERILMNIAAQLAAEVSYLQSLPGVRERLDNPHSLSRVRVSERWLEKTEYQKGELVGCSTSIGRQQNKWLISFVEGKHKNDPSGLLLRAVGTDDTCDYGNESFMRITGIPERFLWEGDKHQFSLKLQKALRNFDSYGHRFRGLEFPESGIAHVFIGEVFGGIGRDTKPYRIDIKFDKKTTIKSVMKQMETQGFGTREFELNDGKYEGPMQGLGKITRDDLVGALNASGIQLKDQSKNP